MSALNVGAVTDSRSTATGSAARHRVFNTRLTVLLLLFVYSGLSAYSGNFLPLRLVNGESMEPALLSGDIILLKGLPFSDIDTGDIIAYNVPDAAAASGPTTILHRVEKTAARNGQRVLITKGDNSSIDPWPVTASQVQGKQVFRIPLLGKPVVLLTSPRGILFVSIAILISLLYIPAMVIFHTTVLRKPKLAKSNVLGAPETINPRHPDADVIVIDAVARTDEVAGLAPQTATDWPLQVPGPKILATEPMSPIADAVEALTEGQRQVKESLTQLGESIAEYATHLKSHTSAVQSLAKVAELLESNIQRQTELMEKNGG